DHLVLPLRALEALGARGDLVRRSATLRAGSAADRHREHARRFRARVGNRVEPGATVEPVALADGCGGDEQVVAIATRELIAARVGDEAVVAAGAVEDVVAAGAAVLVTGFELVVARAAGQVVVTGAAGDPHRQGAGDAAADRDRVVAGAAV